MLVKILTRVILMNVVTFFTDLIKLDHINFIIQAGDSKLRLSCVRFLSSSYYDN